MKAVVGTLGGLQAVRGAHDRVRRSGARSGPRGLGWVAGAREWDPRGWPHCWVRASSANAVVGTLGGL